MRALMARTVPGTSSAGRARFMPWLAMYSISPWYPASSQACKGASMCDKSTSAMRTSAKPSSRPHSLMVRARTARSVTVADIGDFTENGRRAGGYNDSSLHFMRYRR